MEENRALSTLEGLGVLVCRSCQYGVRREVLRTHFRTKHQYTPQQTRTILDYSWKISPDIARPSLPALPPGTVPYPELTLFDDGLLCTKQSQCRYICRTKDSMKEHLRKEHQWTLRARQGRPQKNSGQPDLPWKPVACQRIFVTGAGSNYFEVRTINPQEDLDLDPDPQKSIWDQIEELRSDHQLRTPNIIYPAEDGEISPWLRRTGWTKYLLGFDRAELRASMDEPDARDYPIESRIWMAVRSLLEVCEDTVAKTNIFIRIQIMQTDLGKRVLRPMESYFRAGELHQASRWWQQILLFFVRYIQPHDWQSPTINLNEVQRTLLDRISIEAERETELEPTSPSASNSPYDDQDRAIIQLSILQMACLCFCISLLDDKVRTNEHDVPLIAALAVLGIEGDGWKDTNQYPSLLSAVIKTSRYLVVRHAVEQAEEGKNQEDGTILDFTARTVERGMIRGTFSPMEWMLDLRSYGMKIAFTTTQPGSVDWAGDRLLYREIRFDMSEFRTFVQNLSYEVQQLLSIELLFYP